MQPVLGIGPVPLFPPQPMLADATSSATPMPAANQILPAVHFLRTRANGSSSAGKKMNEVAAPIFRRNSRLSEGVTRFLPDVVDELVERSVHRRPVCRDGHRDRSLSCDPRSKQF